MIDLKNRTREQRVYTYPQDVSAGPVRPTRQTVLRSTHNARNGNIVRREEVVTLGGALTLPARGEVTGLPDILLSHPALQRDIKARNVKVTHRREKTAEASKVPAAKKAAKKRSSRRGK